MITVRFEGGQEILRNLEEMSKPMSRRLLYEGLREAGEPIRKRMSQLAPKSALPGRHLQDNIAIANTKGIDEREVAVAIGPTVEGYYGSFVELGTSDQPAQPYARPAFDGLWQKALAIFGRAMWREIARRGGHWRSNAPTTVEPGTRTGSGSPFRGFEGRTI